MRYNNNLKDTTIREHLDIAKYTTQNVTLDQFHLQFNRGENHSVLTND